MMFGRIFGVALNTYREAVRDRVLYGVVFLAAAVLVFTLALAELSLNQQRRVVQDIGLASISFFSVLVSIFLGASLLYKDIERKTLYLVLPRPIHRWEFLVGKYLGIVVTVAVFISIMGGIQLLVMAAQAGEGLGLTLGVGLVWIALFGLGAWKSRDRSLVVLPFGLGFLVLGSWVLSRGAAVEPVLGSLVLTSAEVMVLSAVTLVFGAFSTPFLSGALSFGVWLMGRSADTLLTIRSQLLSEEMKELLRGVGHVVPNYNLFVPGRAVLEGESLWSYVGSAAGHGVIYAAIALCLATLLFQRRDFV